MKVHSDDDQQNIFHSTGLTNNINNGAVAFWELGGGYT